METTNDAPQKSEKAVSANVAQRLAEAEKTTDVDWRLHLLLRADSEGDAVAKLSEDPLLVSLDAKWTASLMAGVLNGLRQHCLGEKLLVSCKARGLAKQVISGVKQSAEETITRMLTAYGDVCPIMKTFMVCAMMIAVRESPERTAEVIDAILRTWDRETAHIKHVTLELLSAAAMECLAVADEGSRVALRGLEDADDIIVCHALDDIYVYATEFPNKAAELVDAIISRSDDLSVDISFEAEVRLDKLYGMCPERDWEIASFMLDKYEDGGWAQASVQRHLVAFARSCPDRFDEIYEAARNVFAHHNFEAEAATFKELVELVEFFPDREREIVSLILSVCDADQECKMIQGAGEQLVKLVEACPQSAERIADGMLCQCQHDWRLGRGLLSQIGKVAALCPAKAEDIMTEILRRCQYDYYKQVAIETGNTREAVVAAEKEGTPLDDYSVDSRGIHRRAKQEAVSQLGKLAKLLPQKADELFETVTIGWEYECSDVKAAAISQMGAMIEVCPERADEIVTAVVAACGDEQLAVRIAGINQLPALARACPDRAEQFVELLCSRCHNSESSVKIAALGQLTKMTQICPSSARKLFSALLRCCGDERDDVNQEAKERVEAALRVCPEIASDVVLAMIQFSEEAD